VHGRLAARGQAIAAHELVATATQTIAGAEARESAHRTEPRAAESNAAREQSELCLGRGPQSRGQDQDRAAAHAERLRAHGVYFARYPVRVAHSAAALGLLYAIPARRRRLHLHTAALFPDSNRAMSESALPAAAASV